METYTFHLSPSSRWTRILVSHGHDELLKAILPPPQVARPEAAALFLEGLSLWLDGKLRVVLPAGAVPLASRLDLFPGNRTPSYEVEILETTGRRRRELRINGVGDLRDLRQIPLWRGE